MSEQRRPGEYPDELRERAVWMVFEVQRACCSMEVLHRLIIYIDR